MIDEFQRISEILCKGAVPANADEFTVSCHRRLIEAVSRFDTRESRAGDIASLLRHTLRREAEHQNGSWQQIAVSRKYGWANPELWRGYGIELLDTRPDSFLISAREWKPAWLANDNDDDPARFAYRELPRRTYNRVSGDPFLSEAGLSEYLCTGQREAIRAVLTAPSGSTLVVNLPTGAGKSLCAHLPALLFSRQRGTTVVIVPTVALCLDQQAAMREYVSHPTAYYSGAPEQDNRDIRERIRDGTQKIVFTSPESLLQSLSPSVYAATRDGLIRMLVIDEAHIVDEWGDDFRPSFQEVAGMRKQLIRDSSSNPFVTLLLSATITQSCLENLHKHFGTPGPFQMISSVQLRPEPSYWFSYCYNDEVREQHLIEAVKNLPKPMIIYTSEKKDADFWTSRLKREGFRRLSTMTGDTPSSQRMQIVEDWKKNRLDIMVATSAFGLGVDQADVRTVIHACIPESIDRYYQEVGRGGRDGNASVSMVFYTGRDYEIATSLNVKKLIGLEKGMPRWKSMFDSKEMLNDGRYSVRVDVPPGLGVDQLDMRGRRNRDWNVNTLTLMARAGMLELDAEPPRRIESVDTDTGEFQQIWEDQSNRRVIRIINEAHLEETEWERLVETARLETLVSSRKSFDLLRRALESKQCIGDILEEPYRITPGGELEGVRGASVSRSCGGCPYCRKNRIEPYQSDMFSPRPVWDKANTSFSGELHRVMGQYSSIAVFYAPSSNDSSNDSSVDALIRWFVAQGVQNLVAPNEYRHRLENMAARLTDTYMFLYESFSSRSIYPVPTLVMHPSGQPVPRQYLNWRKEGVPLVLLLPEDAKDPARDDRKLRDVFPFGSYLLNELSMDLGL